MRSVRCTENGNCIHSSTFIRTLDTRLLYGQCRHLGVRLCRTGIMYNMTVSSNLVSRIACYFWKVVTSIKRALAMSGIKSYLIYTMETSRCHVLGHHSNGGDQILKLLPPDRARHYPAAAGRAIKETVDNIMRDCCT